MFARHGDVRYTFAVRRLFLAPLVLAIACQASSIDPPPEGPVERALPNDPAGTAPEGTFDPARPDGGHARDGSTTACTPDPANVEIPNNGCDDDANGVADDVAPCDPSLTVDGDAVAFARAMGVCKDASANGWGLVGARYVNGFTRTSAPNADQHGILPAFGYAVDPREGHRLALLSTGFARAYDTAEPGAKTPFNRQPPSAMQTQPIAGVPVAVRGEPPPGWPKAAAGCPALSTDTFDMAGIELQIKVPANAKGLRFDFDFYSGEWPQWVCSRYNDGFVAMLKSAANPGGGFENVSFDAKGNPVSVNFAFFDRCTPGAKTACKESAPKAASCSGGTAELAGTGFAVAADYCGLGTVSTGGGATGWLTSKAPVVPRETITLRLLVWDTGDFKFDSTVLLDHLHWETVDPVVTPSTERAPPVVVN